MGKKNSWLRRISNAMITKETKKEAKERKRKTKKKKKEEEEEEEEEERDGRLICTKNWIKEWEYTNKMTARYNESTIMSIKTCPRITDTRAKLKREGRIKVLVPSERISLSS